MVASVALSAKLAGITCSRMAILISSSTVSSLSVAAMFDASTLVALSACLMVVTLMVVWARFGSLLVGLAPGGTLSILLALPASLIRSSVLSAQRLSVMRSLILCVSNIFGVRYGAGVGSLRISSSRVLNLLLKAMTGAVPWVLLALMVAVPGRS